MLIQCPPFCFWLLPVVCWVSASRFLEASFWLVYESEWNVVLLKAACEWGENIAPANRLRRRLAFTLSNIRPFYSSMHGRVQTMG
jgi:hypothetical protein